MSFPVFDMFGEPVDQDDIIVYALTYGNGCEMRVGKVLDFIETRPKYNNNPNYYLKVEWKASTRFGLPDKPTKISVRPNQKGHFMKVNDDRFN